MQLSADCANRTGSKHDGNAATAKFVHTGAPVSVRDLARQSLIAQSACSSCRQLAVRIHGVRDGAPVTNAGTRMRPSRTLVEEWSPLSVDLAPCMRFTAI